MLFETVKSTIKFKGSCKEIDKGNLQCANKKKLYIEEEIAENKNNPKNSSEL